MKKSHKKTILIIDEDVQLRRVLNIILSAQDFEVLETGNAKEAIEMVSSFNPYIILQDIHISGTTVADLIGAIREWSKSPVILMFSQDNDLEMLDVLEGRVSDYIMKPFELDEIINKVKFCLNKKSVLEGEEKKININNCEVDFDKKQIVSDKKQVQVSDMEFSIFNVLLKNLGKPVTNKQLIKEMKKLKSEAGMGELVTAVGNIRKIIEPEFANPQYLLLEPNVGYRLLGSY